MSLYMHIPLYVHVHVHVHVKQARSVSSYVTMCGSSSMVETRHTTGWSFMGFGNKQTTVSSPAPTTRPKRPPLTLR